MQKIRLSRTISASTNPFQNTNSQQNFGEESKTKSEKQFEMTITESQFQKLLPKGDKDLPLTEEDKIKGNEFRQQLARSLCEIPAYSEQAIKLKLEFNQLIESLDESNF